MQRIKSTTQMTAETDGDDDTCPSEDTAPEPPRVRQRLIIAANRLPISAVRKPDGKWGLNQSAGGLVSALSGEARRQAYIIEATPMIYPVMEKCTSPVPISKPT